MQDCWGDANIRALLGLQLTGKATPVAPGSIPLTALFDQLRKNRVNTTRGICPTAQTPLSFHY